MSARMQVFTSGQGRKTDATDAHAIALAPTRGRGLHPVTGDAQQEVLRSCHMTGQSGDLHSSPGPAETCVIGMLDVEYRADETYLARIKLHPDHQGHGIGTRKVSALIDEAAQKGQDLILYVLALNHRAQALYQRLGMTEVARHGDDDSKITMRSARPHR